MASELVRAAGRGDVRRVRDLLGSGQPADASSLGGRTALHAAAEGGHVTVASMLLEAEAEVNVGDLHGKSPLHLAAAAGHLPMVMLLIEAGADVDAVDVSGNSPLHDAVWARRRDVARRLLAAGANARSATHCGVTALHAAAAVGQLDIARDLLDHGANVNAAARYTSLVEAVSPPGMPEVHPVRAGATPLHWAYDHRHADVVRLLLDRGADPRASDETGATAIPLRRSGAPQAAPEQSRPGGGHRE